MQTNLKLFNLKFPADEIIHFQRTKILELYIQMYAKELQQIARI